MDFISVMRAVAFLYPCCVNVIRMRYPNRRFVWFLTVFRHRLQHGPRMTGRLDNRCVHGYPFFQIKTFAPKLAREQIQKFLTKIFLRKRIPETAYGRGIGNSIFKAEPNESQEGKPVSQALLSFLVTEIVNSLQQEAFEHDDGRICRISNGIWFSLDMLFEENFKRSPVNNSVNVIKR